MTQCVPSSNGIKGAPPFGVFESNTGNIANESLTSLDEKIQMSNVNEIIITSGHEWEQQLNPNERFALRDYTDTGYLNINASLRGKEHFFQAMRKKLQIFIKH